MNSSSLGVIVPVGNDPRIVDCLESLITQADAPPFEVIIIESNCEEPVRKSIASYCEWLPLKTIIHNKRQIGSLRNAGMQASMSDTFYFVDSDCVLSADSLRRAAASGAANQVTRGPIHFVGKSAIGRLDALLRTERYASDPTFAYCPNLVVRREVFSSIGLFREDFEYGSDGEFARRLHLAHVPVTYNQQLQLTHLAPPTDARVISTWIRYGEGRERRLRTASYREKASALFLPNLFSLSKGVTYNFAVAGCLACRWYGWARSSLREDNDPA